MSQTLSLYRLQQIDSQIDRARARLQAIQKTLEDDAELLNAKEEARRSEEALSAAQKNLKDAEREVQNIHIKIEQIDSSLYGGSSHSPKELQDLQNDLAALKRRKVTLEDAQLELMIGLEKAEDTLKAVDNTLQTVRSRLSEQNQGLTQEQDTLLKEVDRLSVERNAVSAAIPAETLRLYDQLRTQKRGLAIATVSERSCDACGSTLSLAQIQSARSSSQMALCPSCGRILYAS